MRRICPIAFVLGVLGTCVSAGHPAAASPTPTSRIVFAANELPKWSGEIYRVTASGQHLNLSRSPAPDLGPSVSPDGRWIAFASGRGGKWAFYVVGSDGRGLRRISSPIFALVPNEIASAQIVWGPDSRELAAEIATEKSAIYLGTRNGGMRLLGRNISVSRWTTSLAFSPKGRMLAYSTADSSVNVVSATGKRLWSAVGSIGPSPWSADDRLAASANSSMTVVYDGRGHKLASFEGTSAVWWPNGSLLASASKFAVQIRHGGVGKPFLRWPARNASSLQWISSTTVRFEGLAGWVGVDVAHDRKSRLVEASTPYTSVVSSAGRVLAEQWTSTGSGALTLSDRGGSATTLATGPCRVDDGDFADLAFMPHKLGVIYQTACYVPSADIYSVKADGSGLRQITNTPVDEMEPSLSPDGHDIVYSEQLVAGKCSGCAHMLWRTPTSGGAPEQLTNHSDEDVAPFDENPTWSPDGSELVFQNSGATAPIRLLTMPSAGGPTHDLNAKGAAVPAWGPKLIAYADWSIPHLVVNTLDPSTSVAKTVATGGSTDVQAFSWSASGRLAYLYDDQHDGHAVIAIVGSNAKPLDLTAHLPPHARVAGLAWSPDGSRFAFAATDLNGNGEIYTIATDGRDLRQITHNVGAVFNVGYESTISWR